VKVAEAAERIGGVIIAGVAEAAQREVHGGYASDLLSDVLGNCHEGDLWVTMQKHINIVAVAQLRELAGIVLVGGRRPDAETLARAEEEHLPVISTDLPTFDVAGILYGLGIRGRRSV
jgi:predicted transcriptional regulator